MFRSDRHRSFGPIQHPAGAVEPQPPPPLLEVRGGARLQRPIRELKGFARLRLDPGETKTARIELGRRAFAYFDTGDPTIESLQAASPVPTEADPLRRAEPGWYVEPGVYRLVLGRSSRDPVATLDLELSGDATHAPA